MLSEENAVNQQLKLFKWKPFDLYNDITIQHYRKQKSLSKNIKECCCDNFMCSHDNYYLTPFSYKCEKIKTKPIKYCENHQKLCTHYNSKYVPNKCHLNDNDNKKNSVNWWTVNLNKCAPSTVVALSTECPLAVNDFAKSQSNKVIIATTTPTVTNKLKMVNNSNNSKMEMALKRSIENASPIVYGPLPYSKYKLARD